MGIYDNISEKQRKDSLALLEDKRVAFAKKLADMGLTPGRALYVQCGGGFHGVVLSSRGILYLTGPGPMEQEDDFTVSVHNGVELSYEEVHIASQGLGGIFGFGKKGGVGFKLTLSFPDGSTGELELVSGQHTFMEVHKGKDPVFDQKRRRGFSNVVWEFKPLEPKHVQALRDRWMPLLRETR